MKRKQKIDIKVMFFQAFFLKVMNSTVRTNLYRMINLKKICFWFDISKQRNNNKFILHKIFYRTQMYFVKTITLIFNSYILKIHYLHLVSHEDHIYLFIDIKSIRSVNWDFFSILEFGRWISRQEEGMVLIR